MVARPAGVEQHGVVGGGGAGVGPHHDPLLRRRRRSGLRDHLGAQRLVPGHRLVDVVERVAGAGLMPVPVPSRVKVPGPLRGRVARRVRVADVGAGPAGRAGVGRRLRRHRGGDRAARPRGC